MSDARGAQKQIDDLWTTWTALDHSTRPVGAQGAIDFTPAARELGRAVQNRESKAQKVLEELRRGPASTATLARVGGVRFGARILELRRAGHRIITEGRADYAIYRLEGEK